MLEFSNSISSVSRTQQDRQRESSVSRTQQDRQREPNPIFRQILDILHVEWRNSMPRFASTSEPRNENINLNKYFIS